MKYKKSMILLLLVIFIFSIATVNAGDMNDTTSEGIMQMEEVTLKTTENEIIMDNLNTFSQLDKDINASHDTFEMKYDYTFSNETDNGPVVINKSNFTINGNNHVLDANMQSGIFKITGSNITINNLVFINGNSNKGGAIYATGHITLNNVTFIGNNASCGGAILIYGSILNCAGSRFIDNYGEMGSSIYLYNATLKVSNSSVTSHSTGKYGQIYATDSSVSIDDSDFINITSAYASALYFEYCESSITNSRFINLTAEKSAGAIAVRWTGNSCIKGCEFINTKSIKNAGAILVDYGMEAYNATVTECTFINSSSMIGGAYIQLGGRLLFNNTDFIDNKASCDGGAVYLSYAQGEFDNCNFNSNIAGYHSDYPALGGAVYSDKSTLIIGDSNFINNSAYLGNAVCAWDSYYIIFGSTFLNNTNAIFTVFDYELSNLENNIYNNDTVVTNESYSYPTYVDSQALELKLINNTINASTLLERFDLRDWNLVSPVKNQGLMGSCWTFGMLSAVESALLKAYGLEFDLSEGNLHHNMMRYSIYGDTRSDEGGWFSVALSYLVGWYGPALEETDPYDEVGKLSPFITEGYDVIHIQDAVIVPNDEVPAGSKLKSAILKYGALAVRYYGDGNDANGYYNPKTSAHYINESLGINHAVSVIGWDDNFSKDNFLITPPGDGAWIVKNSWGTDWGDEGIVYISYYDKTFLPGEFFDDDAFGIVIENTIPYNKNYQHDFIWSGSFLGFDENGVLADDINVNGSIAYANQFEAASDDLIAAVGTYFNSSDVNYTVEIYVNDKLKLIQEGMSPFCGYHTIRLNEYVPVKKGDIFKAVITSNMMPYCYCPLCRVHFTENISFFYNGYEWKDLYVTENSIACLKVYTVEDVDNIINYTFKDLDNHINWSEDVLEIIHDYTFSNETDNGPVVINKSNFTINGNNHVLDANMQSGIFNITGSNITINNLVFINGNSNKGGAIYATGNITLNNVTFIANNASRGGAILINDSILNCAGSRFIDNYGEMGSSIYLYNATLKVSNSSVTSHSTGKYGQIYATDSSVSIDDSDFINITSTYASALYFENSKSSITNSRFINLTAEKSAGAIAVRWTGNSCIKGCEFINTKSIKNAGAILVDYGMEAYNATVTECAFINSSSMIGGAYIQLGGSLILNGSNFTNNNAQVGGAVYISFTNTTIDNCIFESNKLSGNHYGGAVYCDISNLTLTRTEFLNNSTYLGNAVYACDSCYNITSCVFKNNANAIFTDFDKNNCILNNNEYTNDSVITNQSFYSPVSFEYPGLNLTLIDNTISISTPPSRFDLRDWGWITPVKNQGRMGSCWTFAFGEALETALLKATGIRYDVSENYIQNLQIRYSEFGDLQNDEGGIYYMALANVVSWLSVGEEEDEYDEVGKLSVFVESPNKIHLHDVLFIMPDAGNYVDEVKKAILNYGAVSIGYASSSKEPYFNENTSAQYTNESLPADHAVAIIGWDDNYSADNFLITPPENGAWIVKNSWGTEWGDEGYFYLSYYEKSLFAPDPDTGQITSTACIFTNNIDYHVNYQTDLSGLNDFDANYTQYSNEFTSQYDDLIAAVGTYFNQSGINYSFDIYINDKLAHSQSGVSEFAGYRTIVLSKYVSVKKGDKFKVVFKNNNLPYQAYSRQHYIQGMSFVSADGSTWKDITLENRTVCLKVYTVALNDASVSVENDTMDLKVDETCKINATINPDTIMLHIKYTSSNESVATVDKNGIVTAMGEGTAIITLEVGDDEIYAKNSTTVTVTVKKIDTSIDVDSSSLELEIGDNSSIVATLTPADAGNVTFTSSNSSVVAVDAKGNVKAVGIGEANIIVSFAGDDRYAAAENKTVEVTVADYMVVSAPDLTKYYNGPERFVVIVTDSKGNPWVNQSVNITINGVTYSRTTNDNGTASMAIRLVGGQYNVTTIVDNITVYSTVTVLPTVNATDLVKVFRNGTQFYATFKDSNGDYLPEGTMVRFNINGVFYDRQVSGDKGLVKLNINIQQGQYVITSMNLVTGENASNNVTVISRLVENNDLVKYYRNDSQYTVKVIGDDGNAVGAGEIVTFNVHGVLYNRTTNESGIAKLNINLGPGDYIITAKHKDCRVSNNITVLPVLTAKDLTKKYGTPDQFIANLVDGQGNPFAGETVQFNVNGVLYDRVTDSNGQAKLNIRLMPGKYIITSSYNGASISNNITVSA